MNAQTERFTITGPAGILEVARDLAASPDGQQRGTAIIAHPHPLFAGTMDNKVVQTLARAFVASGWTALRFNFRGVGESAGSYDEGRGERDDFLAVVDQLAPEGNLALAGFSFGSFVMSHALAELWPKRQIDKAVFVGTAASRFTVATLPPEAHERTLVVHGEADDTVPLAAVMDWARPQILPVTVVPGGGHFFHGQLPLLKGLVTRHLLSPAA
ncbi:alpha/beta hydrolase [Comamonas piscis]|uniref:Alpha/beta hydrolase n=1 Tax=Comamonas piscis TaxID=1562974 RepID=A0A7G5EBV4_9BURK|nr:alpha/beta fold hydrolase [Comamonas piscis]QMV71479.1 alpha/beta hydrolase [Comamonas piscis]WSO34190.1 alpha/beta fold hydrolase [Comamonas piscis]